VTRSFAVIFALVFGVAACSSDSPFPESAPAVPVDDATFPVEVAGARIEAQPLRIVSLSTVSTEVLFAIGAGEQVIAVDSQSTYPPGAPVTDLSSFEPNVEAIVAFEPDLVFTSFDPGDLVAGLETLGIPTIVHAGAADLDEAYSQIEQVGVATGHVGEATALVAGIRDDLAALAADLPDPVVAPTYFHEIDDTFYTATSTSFIGEIYGLAGMQSIADPADRDGFGYPQLSEEFVLEADPDYIFLADTAYGESVDTVAARPGWDQLTAVQNGNVVPLDSDTASRWGPRIVDFFADIVEALREVPAE
jgi:iron complex transport system substrate-binding protein